MSNKFIILSNSRTGSTWLTTALNQVEDISTDFEIKIPPIYYTKLPNHYLMEGEFSANFWNAMPQNRVNGSKLVLDPKPHDASLIKVLLDHLKPDVKIIFLKRCLAEQTISQMKNGITNKLRLDKNRAENQITKRLELETQRLSNVKSREIELNDNNINFFFKSLYTRLANDLLLKGYLGQGRHQFLEIDYSEIRQKFGEMCEFLGSNANDISNIEDFTITEKVNKQPSNVEHLLKSFAQQTNSLRSQMLGQGEINMSTIHSLYKT